jgi:hypothetical protein
MSRRIALPAGFRHCCIAAKSGRWELKACGVVLAWRQFKIGVLPALEGVVELHDSRGEEDFLAANAVDTLRRGGNHRYAVSLSCAIVEETNHVALHTLQILL